MKNKIKELIQIRYDEEQRSINLYNIIMSVLEPFNGQKISKRMATAILKALPDNSTVHYDTSLNFYSVSIWGNGIEFKDRVRFTLGYKSDPVLKLRATYFDADDFPKDGFEYHNCCHGMAAIERNRKRLALLKSDEKLSTLCEIATSYLVAKNAFYELVDDTPDEYSIIRLVKDMEL